MSRSIIIVTAVHAPSAPFLAEAYKSLREQELPDGWDWHWVIQEDRQTDKVAPHVPDDSRVTFRQGQPGGPGVLALDLAALEADPRIGWATSRAQVHPATLFVRRDLLLALSAVSRGWFTEEVGLLYRKWEGQMTGQAVGLLPVEVSGHGVSGGHR